MNRHFRRAIIPAFMLIALLALNFAPARAQDPPTSAQLNGLRHNYQTWNNCGGANLTMALSYFGWGYDQDVARAWLKPNMEDKNVSPGQMAAFVNQQTDLPNIRAIWRYGGDLNLIKRAVAAGFPVIVEAGFDVDNLGWMGHYETVVAYDDASQTIWVYDSYLGPSQAHTYTDFDIWWRHFNRAFILLFPLDREAEARAVLGAYVDPNAATQIALDAARREATASPSDAWAWFNMGTSFVKLGNYYDAATAFDQAFRLGLPYRLMWYMFGPYEAYYNIGRYDDVLTLAANTEATTVYVEETNYWRGMVYAARGQYDLALNELNNALAFNRHFEEAQIAKTQIESGAFVPPVP
jgi:tetratricopeptide (TPR) repeat protein